MISVDEAWALLAESRPAMPTETVPLDAALDRVLASDVAAGVTLPPHAVSAMDGYAVRAADLNEAGVSLDLIGEAPAGRPFVGQVGAQQAVRIFTGGHIPAGADQVVIQENVTRGGDRIATADAPAAMRHVRADGIDFRAGDTLLKAGAILGPAEIAAAAAADHAEVPVTCKPRVAFLANGNELRLPGSDPDSGDVVASNYFGLSALVRRWGGKPINCGIAADSVSAICDKIEAAREADIIVPVGGASVGDHDHMFAAFEKRGLEPVFRKIAVKPGKPTWLGKLGEQVVLGLPGNPASAYVCAQLFLRTLLRGANDLHWEEIKLADDMPPPGTRETFVRGQLIPAGEGGHHVQPLGRQDSSLITPFLTADCLIRRPANASALSAGDSVAIMPLQR